MPQAFTEWTVLPHGALTAVEENILTVVGDISMPVGKFPRRMTIVRLRDRRLVIFSAIALDEEQMRALEAFGTPAFLIIPNNHHRLDAKIWKDRYPLLQIITPEGARKKVEEIVRVDATRADFNDPDVTLVTVAGTRESEFALEIRRANGMTLVVNDIIGNIREMPGFGGWMFRLMRFAGDRPHVPGPIKWMLVADKAALAAQLRQWAALPGLKRIVVSHGDMIDADPQGALRALAASLR